MMHQRSMDSTTSQQKIQSMLQKDLSTARSFQIRLLCAEFDADISKWGISNPVWIYDNEPRNREIVTRIQRTIDSGGRLVIWPENIDDKDINDMVMSGLDVQSVIKSNTYSGLEAKLKFTNWKKI